MIDPAPKPPRRFDWSALLLGCAAFLVLLASVLLAGTCYLLYLEYGDEWWEKTTVADNTPLFPTATTQAAEALVVVPPTVTPLPTPTLRPTVTPIPVPTATPISSWVPLNVVQRPIEPDMWDDLERMWALDLPPYDYFEVAERLGNVSAKRTVDKPPPALQTVELFKLDDKEISAELAAITENAYFWVEEGYVFNPQLFRNVTNRFESELYPQMVSLFGQEWRPGIDGDPRLHVVHLKDSAEFDEIGFFNSVNQYPIVLDSTSNEREMIFLNMAQLELGDPLYFATMVHELQHLIQWNMDRNEEVWLNEGLSQLAEVYLGFQTSETIDYLDDTSVQLNTWKYDTGEVYKHYAASYLFMTYLWEQLGETAIREIIESPRNGLSSVREVLTRLEPTLSIEEVLGNWALANLLDDVSIDTRYGYQSFRIGFPDKEERIQAFPFDDVKQLPQFGVHYIDIRETGLFTVTFAGDTTTTLLPTVPPVGEHVWFTPSNNDVSATLTRYFDLSAVNSATLEYAIWYELEEEFDFAYVEVSTDNGQNWEILRPLTEARGVYGPAYSGRSADVTDQENGWLFESVSLDEFAGDEVFVRFEVLSDGAFSERGFALTDIQIDEIGYQSDVDTYADEWDAEGFTAVGMLLPQQWSVFQVQDGVVLPVELDGFNRAQWNISAELGATLVIMPQTPFVEEDANYWLRVERWSASPDG